MKTLAKFLIVAAILLGGAAYVAFRLLNAASAEAIERTLAFVFQTDASVGSARLSARDTSLELRNLSLGNPEGYDAENSFSFDRATATVDPASIESGRPGITRLVVHKPVITVEFEGKTTNLSKLIENASRLKDPDADAPSTIPVYFEKIILEEPIAVFIAPMLGTPIDVPIPTFEINNIGTAGEPVTAGEAAAQIAREILLAVTRYASDKLPDSLAIVMQLESVQAIAESALQYRDVLQEKLGLTPERMKGMEDALKEGALKAGQGVLDRLRGNPEP